MLSLHILRCGNCRGVMFQMNHQISNQLLRQLLYIMSIHDEDTVIDSCYTALTNNVARWKPKFQQIIRIFCNWGKEEGFPLRRPLFPVISFVTNVPFVDVCAGASMETLGIYQKFVFKVKNKREASRHWVLPSEMFAEYNYEKVSCVSSWHSSEGTLVQCSSPLQPALYSRCSITCICCSKKPLSWTPEKKLP